MANGRTSKSEHEFRVNKVARLMSVGTVRSDILQFASTEWGVTQRTVDSYIQDAREILTQDFDIDRGKSTTPLLSCIGSPPVSQIK